MASLTRNGEVLASAHVAASAAERRRGLLGRATVDAALVLRPCRQVHTLGMRVPIDVIWCSENGEVLRMSTMPPWRVSRVVWRARSVIEAAAGAAKRWNLQIGDPLEIQPGEAR